MDKTRNRHYTEYLGGGGESTTSSAGGLPQFCTQRKFPVVLRGPCGTRDRTPPLTHKAHRAISPALTGQPSSSLQIYLSPPLPWVCPKQEYDDVWHDLKIPSHASVFFFKLAKNGWTSSLSSKLQPCTLLPNWNFKWQWHVIYITYIIFKYNRYYIT